MITTTLLNVTTSDKGLQSPYGLLCFIGCLFLASAFLTRLAIAYAARRRLLDVPNERSSHDVPTPRGGGLSIVIVFLVGTVFLWFRSLISLEDVAALFGGGLVVAGVGFLDDHGGLKPWVRLIAHFIAAAWVLFMVGGFPPLASGLTAAGVSQNLFWLVALVWFLNAFNFMDGIDGIAAAEGLFIAGTGAFFLFISGEEVLATVALVIFASTSGFLAWNLPPARIFMGDVGSGFLGLVLGALAVMSVSSGATNMWMWAILFGSFITDATVTIFRRIARGERPHAAHCSHAYQNAARRLGSHGRVTLAVSSINLLWLMPLAAAAWRWPELGGLLTALAYGPLMCLALLLGAGRKDRACDGAVCSSEYAGAHRSD